MAQGTPFSSYRYPGIILSVVVGDSAAAAALSPVAAVW
jgi:hypothetical protein